MALEKCSAKPAPISTLSMRRTSLDSLRYACTSKSQRTSLPIMGHEASLTCRVDCTSMGALEMAKVSHLRDTEYSWEAISFRTA
jgi:hypothetical protein